MPFSNATTLKYHLAKLQGRGTTVCSHVPLYVRVLACQLAREPLPPSLAPAAPPIAPQEEYNVIPPDDGEHDYVGEYLMQMEVVIPFLPDKRNWNPNLSNVECVFLLESTKTAAATPAPPLSGTATPTPSLIGAASPALPLTAMLFWFSQSPLGLTSNIFSCARSTLSMFVLETSKSLFGWTLIEVRPREGVVKLITNGSCLSNGKIATGGVLRDAGGAWLSGFSQNLGLGSSFSAELLAILTGINLAKRLGVKRLSVESDNLEAIKMISENHSLGFNSRNLIKSIIRLCSSFEFVEFRHIFREQNCVADRLAAAGHEGTLGVTTLPVSPSFISPLLLEDRIEVCIGNF
ncbi:uncharacterized protein [Euphorbia lathyris]|uniref:uncharacterized protein n=1 Tax=Euphorbia lathyris TaxID=212925 RepID=UPI003313FABD